ncbi:hypothetical protein [Kitasatospora sp. NPDC007106]|uniref:hypothetical protein n=1 Tax=Kitasatospora sp. NPDC007106 TaxID=3156914 RepID=UPI0033CDF91A
MARTGPTGRVERLLRRAVTLALACAAATAAAPPVPVADPDGPDGPADRVAPRAAGWHAVRLPSAPRNQELRSVAALGPDAAWAVGYEESQAGGAPLVERYDGRVWRRLKVPGHRGAGSLEAVLPFGPGDVWAVGSRSDPAAGEDRGLALHWDGRAWREVPLPAGPADRSVHPLALAAAGPRDLWAVGATAHDRTTAPRPLALHWDGSAWRTVPTPGTEGDAALLGAAADRAGGLWAVGVAYDPDGTGRPLTEHWDGRAWRIVDAPGEDGRSTTLESVAVLAPDDVWAAGSSTDEDGPARPYLLHWDGGDWRPADPPADAEGQLHAVAAAPDGTLWAAGEQPGAAVPAFTIRYRDGAWTHHPADPAAAGASFFSVAPVPGTGALWAVGSTQPQLQDAWHPVVESYTP